MATWCKCLLLRHLQVGSVLSNLSALPPSLILLLLCLITSAISQIASNSATTSMLVLSWSFWYDTVLHTVCIVVLKYRLLNCVIIYHSSGTSCTEHGIASGLAPGQSFIQQIYQTLLSNFKSIFYPANLTKTFVQPQLRLLFSTSTNKNFKASILMSTGLPCPWGHTYCQPRIYAPGTIYISYTYYIHRYFNDFLTFS